MMARDSGTVDYHARVWAFETLCAELEREVEVRISALCPPGDDYKPHVEHVTARQGAARRPGWYAQYGAIGLHDVAYRTRLGALLGLLSLIADGTAFPGCATGHRGKIEHREVVAEHGSVAA